MKVYRVSMEDNETDFLGVSRKPLGSYQQHYVASCEEIARSLADDLFGQCVRIEERKLANPEMKVMDMEEALPYEVLADSNFTNDTVIFRKYGNKIQSTIRGGEFREEFKHWYDLSILSTIEVFKKDKVEDMTIHSLEWLDAIVYQDISCLLKIPERYESLVGVGEFNIMGQEMDKLSAQL